VSLHKYVFTIVSHLQKYLKLNKINQKRFLIGYKTQDYVYVHMLEQVYVDLLITNH